MAKAIAKKAKGRAKERKAKEQENFRRKAKVQKNEVKAKEKKRKVDDLHLAKGTEQAPAITVGKKDALPETAGNRNRAKAKARRASERESEISMETKIKMREIVNQRVRALLWLCMSG